MAEVTLKGLAPHRLRACPRRHGPGRSLSSCLKQTVPPRARPPALRATCCHQPPTPTCGPGPSTLRRENLPVTPCSHTSALLHLFHLHSPTTPRKSLSLHRTKIKTRALTTPGAPAARCSGCSPWCALGSDRLSSLQVPPASAVSQGRVREALCSSIRGPVC